MVYIGEKLNIPFNKGMALVGDTLNELYKFPITTCVFKSGECNKNFKTLENILEFMADNHMDRDDTLYAIGGGVTGDLGGLAASLYKRGIRFVQIPTTLTAMVDSSFGGKNGINLSRGKNLVGTYKFPEDIYIDTSFLDTLPRRIYNEGMAEVIKCSIICGEDLTLLPLEDMIKRCLEIKENYVNLDKYDLNERHILNLGHTIGHAIEKDSDYSILHGEAVAIGLSTMVKIFCPKISEKIDSMLKKYDLPTSYNGNIDISLDKKISGDDIKLAIPYDFGDVRIENMDIEEFKRLCKLT